MTEYNYQHAYNAAGNYRLTSEVWKDGSSTINTISVTYLSSGLVGTISDNDSSLSYTYDSLGRVSSISNSGTPNMPTVVLTNGYDNLSRRTTLAASINSTADFTNSYTFDNNGRITSIDQSGTGITPKRVDFTYDNLGRYASITRYENLAGLATFEVATTDYTFDDNSRLTDLTHTQNLTLTDLGTYGWTWDDAGRVTEYTNPDGTTTYTYDDTSQLTAANHSYQANEGYTYDDNGNRTGGGYSVGSNNQMTSDGTYNYHYDKEGNRTKKTDITSGDYSVFEWDHRNRLTAIREYDSSDNLLAQAEYTYDVLDRRIGKEVDSDGDNVIDSEEWYAYDAAGKRDGVTEVPLDDVILVFDDAGAILGRYLHGPGIDQVLALETATDVLWALADHQGTIRDLANFDPSSGVTSNVAHRQYDSFGNITSQTGTWSTFLFGYAGYHWDPDAEMYYVRMRWYDPATGKWVSEDPLGLHALDPNLARFVGNMAAKLTDPSGLMWSNDDDGGPDNPTGSTSITLDGPPPNPDDYVPPSREEMRKWFIDDGYVPPNHPDRKRWEREQYWTAFGEGYRHGQIIVGSRLKFWDKDLARQRKELVAKHGGAYVWSDRFAMVGAGAGYGAFGVAAVRAAPVFFEFHAPRLGATMYANPGISASLGAGAWAGAYYADTGDIWGAGGMLFEGLTQNPQAGEALGRMGHAIGKAGRRAWEAAKPHLRRQWEALKNYRPSRAPLSIGRLPANANQPKACPVQESGQLSPILSRQEELARMVNQQGRVVDRWLQTSDHRWAKTYRDNVTSNPNYAKGIRGRILDIRMRGKFRDLYGDLPGVRIDQTIPGSGSNLRPDLFFPNLDGRRVIFDVGSPSKSKDILKYEGMAHPLIPLIPIDWIP